MSALRYSIIVLPKLDSEKDIRRIREQHDPWHCQISPYIPMVVPFTPATFDEMETVSDYISLARREFHPFAVGFHKCFAADDRVLFPVEEGRGELVALQRSLAGPGTAAEVSGVEYEPRLVVGRVPNPEARARVLDEMNRFGRMLGVVDSVALLALEPAGEMKLVAVYPFGIGRVDFFDRFRV